MKNADQLITDYLDDALNESEEAELHAWLKAGAVTLKRFTEAAKFEQQIRSTAHAKAEQEAAIAFTGAVPTTRSGSRPFQWRPLTSAAAGLAVGLLSASMVFAYTGPRTMSDRRQVVPLFAEDFEEVTALFGRGFPNDAGGWSGDFAAVVSAEGKVSPKEGRHMARLAPAAGRRFCAAALIVDLAEFPLSSAAELRTVEVTASFRGIDTGWADRNQIRLTAFSEAPQDVKAIWNGDSRLEQALQHLGRTVTVKPGEHGWQTLRVSMEIPAGARSLVIHLSAGVADDAGPKTLHYVDDVHAQFVITETTP